MPDFNPLICEPRQPVCASLRIMRQHHQVEQNTASIRSVVPTPELEGELQPISEAAAPENIQAVARVKQVLEHEVYLRKRRLRFSFSWMMFWMMLLLVGAVTGRLTDWNVSLVSRPWLMALYYLMMILPPLKTIWSSRKHLRQSTGTMSELDDVRLIGPLAQMLQIEDRHVRTRAGVALTQLLPRLHASETHLLDTAQRALLCRVLAYPLNDVFRSELVVLLTRQTQQMADLQIAILKAFEQVGDAKALPIVERVAMSKAKTADQQRVHAAAVQCLPYLRARAAQQQAHQSLLRASSAMETNPDILLRPAGATNTPDAQQLLRPDADQTCSTDPFAPFRESARRLCILVLRCA